MISVRDIAWLAGLWEGEGCFSGKAGHLHIALGMTDKDIVQRAADLMRAKVHGPYQYNDQKPVWVMGLGGHRGAGWMMTLYSFLGERRRIAVELALARWQTAQIRLKNRKARCHPERKYQGNGLCKTCYHRNYMRAYRGTDQPRQLNARRNGNNL